MGNIGNRIFIGILGAGLAYVANQAMGDAARMIVYAVTGDEKVLKEGKDEKKS